MDKKTFMPFIHFSIWMYKSVSEELMYQAQEFPQITPMEIDILFQLVALRHQTGYVIVHFNPFSHQWTIP